MVCLLLMVQCRESDHTPFVASLTTLEDSEPEWLVFFEFEAYSNTSVKNKTTEVPISFFEFLLPPENMLVAIVTCSVYWIACRETVCGIMTHI